MPSVQARGTSWPRSGSHRYTVDWSQSVIAGTVSASSWTNSARVVTRDEGLGEREEGPGRGVAALGVGEDPEDVEGRRRVLGEQAEHLGLRRWVDRVTGRGTRPSRP